MKNMTLELHYEE